MINSYILLFILLQFMHNGNLHMPNNVLIFLKKYLIVSLSLISWIGPQKEEY